MTQQTQNQEPNAQEVQALGWLNESDDGESVVITLKKPIKVDGQKVETLTMREPTVLDQKLAQSNTKTNVDMETQLFANLCGIPSDVVNGMKLSNYNRLQIAYSSFLD